jgi:ketosteroid isomerase-like protein
MGPTRVTESLSELMSAGDTRAALELYEAEAAFVVERGTTVFGRDAIGTALEGFSALRPTLAGDIEQVVEAGDVALVANRWMLSGTGPDGTPVQISGRSADVLRRCPDGDWRILIDDPWGGGA